ncbi:MAG: Coenzyme F390 synthetase-like protein [Promethearchaeota archaeon CR_4]|nr:MAG: Coenzyme F390 synthetase-like protein [Candidatus Lokiarchaeota archaeon CR_4]
MEGGIRYEPCPYCGRKVPIIDSLISRVSEQKTLSLTKVKGTLVDLNQFYTILPSIPEIEEWQIVLKKEQNNPFGGDELHIYISIHEGRRVRNKDAILKHLEKVILDTMEIAPTAIHVQTLDQVTHALGMETQLKELRVLDLRPKM